MFYIIRSLKDDYYRGYLMGLQELPNGMQYFSLSEELDSLLSVLFSSLNSFNIALLGVLTLIFLIMIIFWVFKAPAGVISS